jgi:hypothetical protein
VEVDGIPRHVKDLRRVPRGDVNVEDEQRNGDHTFEVDTPAIPVFEDAETDADDSDNEIGNGAPPVLRRSSRFVRPPDRYEVIVDQEAL